MEIKQFKLGEVVEVIRIKKASGKVPTTEVDMDTAPTVGRIVYVHPERHFYVVEFRDRYSAEYKPMYRESFFPDRMNKISQFDFMATRPAMKRSWAV